MKSLKTLVLSFLLSLVYFHSSAQTETVPLNEPDYNKPKLFADLPQRMQLKMAEMETLFVATIGSTINKQVSEQFRLQGTVVSVFDGQDASIKSVVIRATNRAGAIFTFTRITNADGSYSYIGRMISRQHSDAYELVKENDQYILSKTGLYDLFAE